MNKRLVLLNPKFIQQRRIGTAPADFGGRQKLGQEQQLEDAPSGEKQEIQNIEIENSAAHLQAQEENQAAEMEE